MNLKFISNSFVFLSALFILSGCFSKRQTPANDSLVVAISAGPRTLDPRYSTDAVGQRMNSLIFNSFVRLGPELKIVGDAAKSWKYANKVYTFEMVPDLNFSDDTKLTCDDIQFSVAEYQKTNSPFQSAFSMIKKVECDFSATPSIVKFHLSTFSATLLTDLTNLKLLPKGIVNKFGDDFADHLIGTGSYKLIKRTEQEIIFEARKNHPIITPHIPNLVFKIVKDDSTRFLKLRSGAIDIIQSDLPPNKIAELESNSDFTVHKVSGPSMDYILVNLKDSRLAEVNLRRAISQAINRDEIVKFKLSGLALPASGILSPKNPFADEQLQPPTYLPSESKKLVADLDLKNKAFSLKTSNNPQAIENGKVIAAQLESIGLKIELQSFEWGTFYNDIKNGNFQLATMRWVGATDPDIYRLAFHSKELPPGRNRGSYKNEALDLLLDKGLEIEEEGARKTHYHKVQRIIFEDLPIIPLWYDTLVSVVSIRVDGYVPPLNGDYSPYARVTKPGGP
ncbi:MAG: hypothetical protein COT74_08920 [Bdellovibrionales bacterium CG10_big_fil_rev_8_21_14_0_10_45_34]|nr:MAG: hypothetical protein COT74_08920 [Bdellovibrionales bacterium CG10_big_fil_rev_8_21_14_0_10_45_34]